MVLDVLTTVLGYALVYAGVYYGPATDLAVNWTAINATTWWVSDDLQATQDVSVKTTQLTWDESLVTDLKERLTRNVSYVAPLENSASTYGFNSDYLPQWTEYWAKSYDFTGRLEKLNSYPLYKTNIQGLDITYYRITPTPSSQKPTITLLMLHGFPSSPVEFIDTFDYITQDDASRSFNIEVIAPSLPGFGWSSGASKTGFGAAQMAVVMNSLMQRLGIPKYYVHGSDMGSAIGSDMATLFPENVLGYHSSWPRVLSPVAYELQLVGYIAPNLLTNAVTVNRTYPNYDVYSRIMDTIAYIHWQATKPDTAGIPFTDSASGLLAWVLDIFARLTDYNSVNLDDGGLLKLNKDKLIDNLMFYWAPASFTTAARLHAETYNKAQSQLRLDEIPTEVPTWALQTKYALTYQPELILKLKYPNLVRAEVLDFGGHFLGFEEPQTLGCSIVTALTAFKTMF